MWLFLWFVEIHNYAICFPFMSSVFVLLLFFLCLCSFLGGHGRFVEYYTIISYISSLNFLQDLFYYFVSCCSKANKMYFSISITSEINIVLLHTWSFSLVMLQLSTSLFTPPTYHLSNGITKEQYHFTYTTTFFSATVLSFLDTL